MLSITNLLAATLMITSAAEQGQADFRMDEPNLYERQSTKKIIDLEFCVAKSVHRTGALVLGAYRDGPGRVVIYGNRIAEQKIFLAIFLTENNSGTKIEVKGRNPDALSGFQESLEKCS